MAKVALVLDANSIILEDRDEVLYIGIETPRVMPTPAPFGLQALEANRRLVEKKEVRLERDFSERDRYGKLLRYVYVGDTFVNAELVRLGLARAVAIPPDIKYKELFEKLEREAREARRGIWETLNPDI
ncbi:MAG: thermonuclease family protein [Chloroflexi bacterium]|nr:thermonuclease family protein [Chloroflexota bacterium]